MPKDKTDKVANPINHDPSPIEAKPPARALSKTQQELQDLREKLAQANKTAAQTLELVRKQGTHIRALGAQLEEKIARIGQLDAETLEKDRIIQQQNRTLSRLLNLPPNASELQ